MNHNYTLYGYLGSGSAAVEAALLLIGLPHRIVDAASWDEQSAREELLQLNPLGQIPTLKLPDGSVLTESAAILIDLALRHPESGLLPTEPAARGRAIRGLTYIAANCYAVIGIIDYPERFCAEASDDTLEHIRQGSRDRLHALWDSFADTFEPQPYLSGEQPGALDLLTAVVSRWSGARKHLKRSRPAWYAVLDRIESHPALAGVFKRHWPPE
jgi:GST-like protein